MSTLIGSAEYPEIDQPELSMSDLAKFLIVSRQSLLKLCTRGEIQCFVRGRRRFFTREEVRRFIRRNTYTGTERVYPDE